MTPLWTLKRVHLSIERKFDVRYSEVHVWRVLEQLGLSSQKPERRAFECDDPTLSHALQRPIFNRAARYGIRQPRDQQLTGGGLEMQVRKRLSQAQVAKASADKSW